MGRFKHIVSSLIISHIILSTSSVGAASNFRDLVPVPERRALLNGMRFWFFDYSGQTCPFVLMVENGAAFDPLDKWGATNLMVQVLLSNLERENYLEELTARGIQLHGKADWDALYFFGQAPPDQLEFALLTLADLLVRPDFPESSFQSLRDKAIEQLRSTADDPFRSLGEAVRERLFGPHPYAHPVIGTEESLRGLYVRDLKIQARRLLLPNQACLAIAYSGDRDALFRRLSRRWGAWVRGEAVPFTFRRADPPREPHILFREAAPGKSILRWSALIPERGSGEFLTFKTFEQYLLLSLPDLAETVTGTGQIQGTVEVEARKMYGVLELAVQLEDKYLVAFLDRFQQWMDQTLEGDIDEGRLAEAKRLVLQDYGRALEDPYLRLFAVLETDLYKQGSAFLMTLETRLERITAKRFVRDLSGNLSARSWVAAVSGNPGLVEGLERFGVLVRLH